MCIRDRFDELRASVQADRSKFFTDLSLPFYGYNRPGAKVSEGVRHSFWLQGMIAGFPACYFCIKAFSETDQTEDLKKIDVPTLIIHGDSDAIVPFEVSGQRSATAIAGSEVVVIKNGPHGINSSHAQEFNQALLTFLAK